MDLGGTDKNSGLFHKVLSCSRGVLDKGTQVKIAFGPFPLNQNPAPVEYDLHKIAKMSVQGVSVMSRVAEQVHPPSCHGPSSDSRRDIPSRLATELFGFLCEHGIQRVRRRLKTTAMTTEGALCDTIGCQDSVKLFISHRVVVSPTLRMHHTRRGERNQHMTTGAHMTFTGHSPA